MRAGKLNYQAQVALELKGFDAAVVKMYAATQEDFQVPTSTMRVDDHIPPYPYRASELRQVRALCFLCLGQLEQRQPHITIHSRGAIHAVNQALRLPSSK
jgi:hypothetical protein